ncbi:hypothetical protein T492DRAFT_849542 [Pavlovales sp. CCMP2436]|nr:hypothetical protein T492DRAFT_849542 [Pavlovales sp. CCMP2436]
MGGEDDEGFNASDPRSIQMGLSNIHVDPDDAEDSHGERGLALARGGLRWREGACVGERGLALDSSGWLQAKMGEFTTWMQQSDQYFDRHIIYEERRTYYGSVMSGRDQRNNVLQKAITLYIDEHCAKQVHRLIFKPETV